MTAIKDRILVIEDERSIENMIVTLLEANGYDVIVAHSGREALGLSTSHCPDLLLIDHRIPAFLLLRNYAKIK